MLGFVLTVSLLAALFYFVYKLMFWFNFEAGLALLILRLFSFLCGK